MTAEMMLLVAELNVGGVVLVPAVPHAMRTLPQHMNAAFVPVVLTDGLSADHPAAVVIAPGGWATRRAGHTVVVTAVTQVGFAPGARAVQVGRQTRRPLRDGYFVIVLPVGSFPARGIAQDAVRVAALVPHTQFFDTAPARFAIAPDDRLHVLVVGASAGSSAGAGSSADATRVKMWIVGTAPREGIEVEAEALPRFWPAFLARPESPEAFRRAAKFALLDLLMPLEVAHVLVLDGAAVVRGDAQVFRAVDLRGAACAAPLMSSSRRRVFWWNAPERVRERFGRPFHTTALAWIDLERWREVEAGAVFRRLYERAAAEQRSGLIDDDLFNLMQLDVQVATLPEGTVFCPWYNSHDLAEGAFAHVPWESGVGRAGDAE
jgi:hypothetical protein